MGRSESLGSGGGRGPGAAPRLRRRRTFENRISTNELSQALLTLYCYLRRSCGGAIAAPGRRRQTDRGRPPLSPVQDAKIFRPKHKSPSSSSSFFNKTRQTDVREYKENTASARAAWTLFGHAFCIWPKRALRPGARTRTKSVVVPEHLAEWIFPDRVDWHQHL